LKTLNECYVIGRVKECDTRLESNAKEAESGRAVEGRECEESYRVVSEEIPPHKKR
jgi:hypothetical protein